MRFYQSSKKRVPKFLTIFIDLRAQQLMRVERLARSINHQIDDQEALEQRDLENMLNYPQPRLLINFDEGVT